MYPASPLSLFYLAIGASLLSGAFALLSDRYPAVLRMLVFPMLGISAVAAVAAGLLTLTGASPFNDQLALGLPWLHWHLRLDNLAAFFLEIIGLVTLAVSIYGPGYVREYIHGHYSLALLGLMTGLFIAGMQLVVVADDAFVFMVAWELMSVSSYFLVAYEHQESASRRAALLYLLMAQIGALLILLAFGVLAAFAGDFTFASMRHFQLAPMWASIAFALGLTGFGMKAGIVPLHVWLPEAHPVAPSHVSALMSGVMLKMAIYGFIRLAFSLVGPPQWGWGVVLLAIGSITALYGVLYALMQQDLKRVLAYSSIENVGIIFIALGLSLIFFSTGLPTFGVLGLVAALYHALNHALFKSLLFLAAGAVHQHAHERNLEHMGGLIRRMPWTALFSLIGCLSISDLPPFNGFVSVWLTFQTALQATHLSSGVLRAVIPMAAAALALSGALAAACFVRLFGITFLGQARTRRVRHAREASPGMVVALCFMAVLCVLFGVLPTNTVNLLSRVVFELTGHGVSAATHEGWMWLTPVSPRVASYSGPLIFAGVLVALGTWAAVYLALHRRRRNDPVPRVEPWDCGFGALNPRMQYSAAAMSMPIRQIFRPVWLVHEEVTKESDSQSGSQVRYGLHVEDIAWHYLYLPVERFVQAAARRVSRIQTGHLRHYLAYSFFTLLLLLWLIT